MGREGTGEGEEEVRDGLGGRRAGRGGEGEEKGFHDHRRRIPGAEGARAP